MLAAMLDHWRDTLPRRLWSPPAPVMRFDALFGELHRFFMADPDRARLLVREMLDRPGDPEPDAALVRPWLGAKCCVYTGTVRRARLHYRQSIRKRISFTSHSLV